MLSHTLRQIGVAPLIAVLMLVGACGNKPKPQQKPKTKAKAPQQKRVSPVVVKKVKTKSAWFYIQPHFEQFVNSVDTMDSEQLRDPFENTMNTWIPQRIKVAKKKVVKKQVTLLTPLEDRPPIERFSVAAFRLKAIMSATDVPKALLVDPKGNGYIVWKDRIVGSEKGQIVAINQYDVIIRVPGKEPVKKTIKPVVEFKTFY